MGDADAGGSGGASSLDSGDASGLAVSRALMEGGSLPPRKRLLAGLKQNGWLSTSPPPEVSPTAGGYAGGVGSEAVGMSASVGGVVRSESGKYGDGCMGCNALEGSGLRRIKRGGVSLRLCSACTLLYSKSMFCPYCLVMYHDASLLGDPSMWLVCSRCRRSVHPECEQKHSGSMPDAASYVCLDCVNSARRQRESNGVTGMRSKPSSGRPVPNFHGEAGASAGLGADYVSPALKKPRMMRERSGRPGDHEHADGSRFERDRSGPDASGVAKAGSLGPPRNVSSQAQLEAASPQEAAEAARSVAIAAAKVATAAKANAAAKAGLAVKAAAAAKAALEAAAHAAKADAAARAELRRKMANAENRLAGGGAKRLEINVHSEPRRERSSKGEVKYERDDGYGGRRASGRSVDDEEVARQLHRVMNSSPRISRSATPMRRKASVKPETPSSGVSNSSAETVRARPRTGAPSPAEPAQEQVQVQHELHLQFKHQQTRPRSITHKELRRIDSKVSRHDVKMAEDGNHQECERVGGVEPSIQEASLNHMGSHSAEELASGVKGEAMDGVLFAPVGVQEDASILFDALVEVDGEGMHAAVGSRGSHDRRPDYLQEILEAAVLTDTAMSFNDGAQVEVSDLEIDRSVTETAEQGREALTASGLHGGASEGRPADVKGNPGEPTALEAKTFGQGDVNASSVVRDVEMQEAGGSDVPSVTQEDRTSGPSGMSEARLEERLGGEPLVERREAKLEERVDGEPAEARNEAKLEERLGDEPAEARSEARLEGRLGGNPAEARSEANLEERSGDEPKEARLGGEPAEESSEVRLEERLGGKPAEEKSEAKLEEKSEANLEERLGGEPMEERLGGEPAEERRNDADAIAGSASTSCLMGGGVCSTGSDERKSDACESGECR